MPIADKHRHYRLFTSSLLAILLACLVVTAGAISTSNLAVRGRVNLEHNAKINSSILHGSRQELSSVNTLTGPGLDAVDGPDHVASTGREAADLVPLGPRTLSVHLKNVILPSTRDRVLSSRAPPSHRAPQLEA